MQIKSKELQNLKAKLKDFIQDKEVLEVILFGSFIKGKAVPKDIDIALITEKSITKKIPNIHISVINPKELIVNPTSLVSTLIKDGYSLKNNKFFAEKFNFEPKVLFLYNLSGLNASEKVKVVRILRGDKKNEGFVTKENGKWLSNNVFLSEIKSVYLFEQFFIKNKVNFTKHNLLMH